MDSQQIADRIRQCAAELGFDQCGIAPAITSEGFSGLSRWIDSGYAAEMSYFADRLDAYRHPEGVLDGAKSIIALTWPYDSSPPVEVLPGHGRVARYAWTGTDYHDVIHPKLKKICRYLREMHPAAHARGVVDTAPLMEREVAQLAGLGWRGKNTLLLNKHRGSYFFLACVLVDFELPYDDPHETDHCGTCTACLDACPTDAFPQPGVLDASKCISYLTIEHRGPITNTLKEPLGDWLFGCDVCQEVCPWNRKHGRDNEAPVLASVALVELFSLDDEMFRQQYRKTPFWRTRRRGILRNAAIVLGNRAVELSQTPGVDQDVQAWVDALNLGLADEEWIVRDAAAWALGKIRSPGSTKTLRERLSSETHLQVREQLSRSLQQILSKPPIPPSSDKRQSSP